MYTVYSTSFNGQVDCGSGSVDMELDCTFPCDLGYMLLGSVTCEKTRNWSGGLPSCVPLNCNVDDLPVPANTTVLKSSSCNMTYQSQCTVSCAKGFTGDDVTYLCNVTSDPTIVDWVVINGPKLNQECKRGMLSAMCY